MKLDENSLAAWDSESHAWKVYPGAYFIIVGSSSCDIRLTGAFTADEKYDIGLYAFGLTHKSPLYKQ
jgi:hypothetical protein